MNVHYFPLIKPDGVLSLFDRPDVVFVDARGGPDSRERFAAGHLQGAVFVDLERELSAKTGNPAQGGRHPLPAPADFGILLGNIGIHPGTKVIVYDDKAGANAAARFWWMMRAAGHELVWVIDGGYSAVTETGLPVTKGESLRRPAPGPYPVKDWNAAMVDINLVAASAQRPGSVLIDVREAYRYRGEREPIDLTAGHIPGAVNIPYSENLRADGKFLEPDVLAERYRSVIGDTDLRNVTIHCGSGVTACHTLLALESAGLPGASLYVGSWSEWSRNNRPIATGDEPG